MFLYAFTNLIQYYTRQMPDPYVAKRSIWLPFIKDELKADEDTILGKFMIYDYVSC